MTNMSTETMLNRNVDLATPKKPCRPFLFYFKEFQQKISKELEDKLRNQTGCLSSRQQLEAVAREAGRRWKSLPASQKMMYNNMYFEDERRYNQECDELMKKTTGIIPVPDAALQVLPQSLVYYFIFVQSNWRKMSECQPHLSPDQVQELLWSMWTQGKGSQLQVDDKSGLGVGNNNSVTETSSTRNVLNERREHITSKIESNPEDVRDMSSEKLCLMLEDENKKSLSGDLKRDMDQEYGGEMSKKKHKIMFDMDRESIFGHKIKKYNIKNVVVQLEKFSSLDSGK